MRLGEILRAFDALRENEFPQGVKAAWLLHLDQRLLCEGQLTQPEPLLPQVSPQDLERQMLLPEAWQEVYFLWLEANVRFYQGDEAGYRQAAQRFQEAWQGYRNYCTRTHLPSPTRWKFP